MSNLITDWAAAVVTHLQTEFPTAEVVHGRRPRDGATAVNRRQTALIAVFWPGWEASDRDLALARPTLRVRYWPSVSKQPSTSSPADPSALEQAAVDLMSAFAGKRKGGDFVSNLACYVASVTPFDRDDDWYVEAVLQGIASNIAVTGA